MARTLSRSEVVRLADSVRSLLDAINAGNIDASVATVHRLEGAAVALEAVLGRVENAPDALLGPDHEIADERLL